MNLRRKKEEEKLRRQKEEEKLDRGIELLLHRGRTAYSNPEVWLEFREQMRLTVLYPGRWVAFRDHFEGEGVSRRLLRREVLRSARSAFAVSKYLASLPEKEQRGVFIDFVEPR